MKNPTQELKFFLLGLGKKAKTEQEKTAIQEANRDISPFLQDEDDEGIYAFVWETYAQLRIKCHEGNTTNLPSRKVYAQLAQRLGM